ncbi:MAG: hypothetical protein V7K89_03760, partial [Nostoc sp.]
AEVFNSIITSLLEVRENTRVNLIHPALMQRPLMIEVHPNPAKALSDGPQSLTPEAFEDLMLEMASLGKFFGRWSKQHSTTVTPKFAARVSATASSAL